METSAAFFMHYLLNPLLQIHTIVVDGRTASALSVRSADDLIVPSDGRISEALQCLKGFFTAADGLAMLSAVASLRECATELWQYMLDEHLIVAAPQQGEGGWIAQHREWSALGWSDAANYHFATRDHPFLDMSKGDAFATDNSLMQSYAKEELPPPVFLELRSDRAIQLQKLTENGHFPIPSDNTQTSCPPNCLTLASWLDLAFGVRQYLLQEESPEDDFVRFEMIKKAVPSGGSKHPVEVFVDVRSKDDGTQGLYHYSVKDNSLRLIVDSSPTLRFGAREEAELFAKSNCVFYLKPMLERAMWRYRDSRSWRAVAFDVGHAASMLQTAIKTSGFSSQLLWSFDTDSLCESLATTQEDLPLYAVVALIK